jgi:protein SCO1/2
VGAAEPSNVGSSSTAGGQSGKTAGPGRHPLLGYSFTNELGQSVRLADFRGQALAITFFFTRCPRPEFCPRLSKNFQEASLKLAGMANAPTNWHFLSVTFDPEFDTPAVLKAYGNAYHYDSNHWSFLTGPPDKIEELTRLSQVAFKRQGGTIDHDFRTLVIDAAGSLQMAFPVSGDLTEALVAEVLKAAAVKPEGQ